MFTTANIKKVCSVAEDTIKYTSIFKKFLITYWQTILTISKNAARRVAKNSSWGFRFRYSCICQGTSTRRQRSDLFGLPVKLRPVTTSLTTQR